jgi:thiol-disulfide isomerase/thioredoxin
MEMKQLFVAMVIAVFPAIGFSQGIEFFKGTWEEALAASKREGKPIFVDAYAEWCGPCKRMAAQTFPDPKVGAFFNANFVCLKVDMEKQENAQFVSKFPVSAYPTLMFIDENGGLVLKQTGAQGVDGLLELGKKALGKADKTEELAQRYEDGERDAVFLLQYVKALNRSGKSSLKIVNDYLATQSDLSIPINLNFIFEGSTEADSRVFDLLIKNKDALVTLYGLDKFNARVERACWATVSKAIEYKDEKLLAEAKSKSKLGNPVTAVDFGREADLKYSAATQNAKQYLKAMKARQKSLGNSAARLADLSTEMFQTFPTDSKVLKQAEKWASQAAKTGGLPEYYLTWAEILKRMGEKDKAIKVAKDGKKAIGENDKGMGPKLDMFLHSLDQN